jgi:hypothetical protein
LFQAQGLGTVLVDAPRSHQGPDGLGGHRVLAEHADELGRVIAAVRSVRAQAVTVTGGPCVRTADPLQACEGRSPHGFAEQEADVAQGIARFVRGARY